MRKKYQSYRILSARTVSATGPRNSSGGGGSGFSKRQIRRNVQTDKQKIPGGVDPGIL